MQHVLSILFIAVSFALTAISPVKAGISLDATRIVFSEKNIKQGQHIGITSSILPDKPYLVRAQILSKPDNDSTNTPFLVSPSLFRLEPGSTNQLRIMLKGSGLQQDRESIYYLRVIAQPAGKYGGLHNIKGLGGEIMLSTGSIIKVFYRPKNLLTSQKEGMSGLKYSRKGNQLYVYNSSPYYITLSSLIVGGRKIPLSLIRNNTMLPPFSGMSYRVEHLAGPVTWKAINDYGGSEEFHGEIN